VGVYEEGFVSQEDLGHKKWVTIPILVREMNRVW